MSVGLEALLEAAHFLEQQEKLKLSPQLAAPTININEQRYIVQRSNNFDNVVVTTAAGVGLSNHNSSSNSISASNNIVNSNCKNGSTRHINSVSSSAPAAGATFHHANGLTITSSNNSSTNSNSQLLGVAVAATTAAAANQNNDYEFSRSNHVAGVATTQQATNGRSSEGRINEDQFSSNVVVTTNTNNISCNTNSTTTTTSPNNNSSSFVLTTKTDHSKHPATTLAAAIQKPQQQQPQHQYSSNKTKSASSFALVDGCKISAAVGSAAASKQMLLNGGVRIASPAATIGGSSSSTSSIVAAKVNAFTTNAQQQQNQQQLTTSFPLYTTPNSTPSHALTSLQRHKKCNPLTPPPMPSRKFVETNHRIRSFSFSSNKFTAAAAVAAANAGSSHQQLLQHTSEDSHMSYVSGGSSGASPPRHLNGSGSHYIQMMSSGGAGSQGTQSTPLIGGSGRRRTISSNSNGAGTREVHNKLEKNRRAHLKECYEQLKNQLQLRDEDRKKTSNLAILGEALKHVMDLKQIDQELEAQVEELAKEKINAQKKIVSLKRELGSKFEQMFASIMPDDLVGSIPVERENINDSGSLSSSGRGSLLYSSSSSLSSGGSSNNNTVSSPVGAGLQTAMPTALSPVISQKMTTNSTVNSSCIVTTTTPMSATQSPISPNMLLQQIKSASTSAANSMASSPLGGGSRGSPAGSPTTIEGGVVTMPLSLTAKNISATSLTRGSPTPSTPSPSPSSSSGVSSSSSIISSSPPMNGVINGRNVTVNIPNGLKFQATAGGNTTIIGPAGTATAVNSSNNATTSIAAAAAVAVTSTATTSTNSTNALQGQRYAHGRKTSLSIASDAKLSAIEKKTIDQTVSATSLQDGEQPAKVIKVFNNHSSNNNNITLTSPLNSEINHMQLSQVGSAGSLVVSSYPVQSTTAVTRSQPPQLQKILMNGSGGVATSELGRLPGGAELNILPAITSANSNEPVINGTSAAAAFFHANGKLTLLNSGNGSAPGGCGSNGILLKATEQQQHHPTFSLSNGNILQLTPATAASLQLGGLAPMFVATAAVSHTNGTQTQFAAGNENFAQLLAAATAAGNQTASIERFNGGGKSGVGSFCDGQTLPLIGTQYLGSMKPMIVSVTSVAATQTHTSTTLTSTIRTAASQQHQQVTTNDFPTLTQKTLTAVATSSVAMTSSSSISTSLLSHLATRISSTVATVTLTTTAPPITATSFAPTSTVASTKPPASLSILSSSSSSSLSSSSSTSSLLLSSSLSSATSVTTSNAVVTGTTNGNAL